MAKLALKLKKAGDAAAPAAGAAPSAAAPAAPGFAMSSGGSGGIKLVLKDAKITIDKVVVAK